MRLVWNPVALDDREEIMDYIAEDNPVAAIELDELIKLKANELIDRPEIYRAGRVRGTREMVVHSNYVVIYKIWKAKDVIEILRVKHAAQQWPKGRG